jgi:hypothetical protein
MKTRVFAVCVVVFLFCGITHAGLSDGLVAYYPFNGNANDESGNGNNGIVYGATLTTDRLGNENKAYSFDGISNYIKAAVKNIPVGNSSRSMTAWVKPTTSDFHLGIIGYGESGGIQGSLFGLSPNSPNQKLFFWGANQDYQSNLPIIRNKWTFIAVIYDGSKIKLYADNQSESYNIGILKTGMSDFYIGVTYDGSGACGGFCSWFKGGIDDIRIYNRALSESEIQQLYNEGQVCPDVAVKPYTFTSGTSAKAAEVNADFNTLYQQINTQNCQLQALKAIVCTDHPTASVCQ